MAVGDEVSPKMFLYTFGGRLLVECSLLGFATHFCGSLWMGVGGQVLPSGTRVLKIFL